MPIKKNLFDYDKIKSNMETFMREFLKSDYEDFVQDLKSDSKFNGAKIDMSLYIEEFLADPLEDTYGGNGSYDPYILTKNYLKEIMHYLNSE